MKTTLMHGWGNSLRSVLIWRDDGIGLRSRVRWFADTYLGDRTVLIVMIVAAVLGGAYAYFAGLAPAMLRRDEAVQAASTARQRTQRMMRRESLESLPSHQLNVFYAGFPPERDLPNILENIFNSAQDLGLPVTAGTYGYSQEKTGQLVRYSITLPLKGTYPRVRQFVASLRTTAPTAAISEVRLQRPKVSADTIEARVKLTLFLRRNP